MKLQTWMRVLQVIGAIMIINSFSSYGEKKIVGSVGGIILIGIAEGINYYVKKKQKKPSTNSN